MSDIKENIENKKEVGKKEGNEPLNEIELEVKRRELKSKKIKSLESRILEEQDKILKKAMQDELKAVQVRLKREVTIEFDKRSKETSRKIKTGANLEAILGVKDEDEMLETIFTLLHIAKNQNVAEFMKTPYDRKAEILRRMEKNLESVPKDQQLKGNQKQEIEKMVQISNRITGGLND